ncbi:YueI family protein [Oceanobacillus damuensis]|uniref:YueI family protein n=1 Tax=Oceanobacillus damuensis TaxID=937928 RepID=UPI00082A2979|nr:YueI family protein [Oceanobacillus damuensis]
MSKKNVDDYLTEGLYGTRLPKEQERIQFLGTLRERVVLALTIGQVMTDSGIRKLEEAIKENPEARLLINGHVAYRFLKAEKALANKYNIPYTTVTNNEKDTDIGAVLTYEHAIDKEIIFIEDEQPNKGQETTPEQDHQPTFLNRVKKWFGS